MNLPFSSTAGNELPILRMCIADFVSTFRDKSHTPEEMEERTLAVIRQADKVVAFDFIRALLPLTEALKPHFDDPSWEEISKYVVRRIPLDEKTDVVDLFAAMNYFESYPAGHKNSLVTNGYMTQIKHNLKDENLSLDARVALIDYVVNGYKRDKSSDLYLDKRTTNLLAAVYLDALKQQTFHYRGLIETHDEAHPAIDESLARQDVLQALYLPIANNYARHGLGEVADIAVKWQKETEIVGDEPQRGSMVVPGRTVFREPEQMPK